MSLPVARGVQLGLCAGCCGLQAHCYGAASMCPPEEKGYAWLALRVGKGCEANAWAKMAKSAHSGVKCRTLRWVRSALMHKYF